jgi:hypothetical protein
LAVQAQQLTRADRRLADAPRRCPDGGQLGDLLDRDNLASGAWADTAYSAANLALLDRR